MYMWLILLEMYLQKKKRKPFKIFKKTIRNQSVFFFFPIDIVNNA